MCTSTSQVNQETLDAADAEWTRRINEAEQSLQRFLHVNEHGHRIGYVQIMRYAFRDGPVFSLTIYSTPVGLEVNKNGLATLEEMPALVEAELRKAQMKAAFEKEWAERQQQPVLDLQLEPLREKAEAAHV